jgi:hypothetical protein
LLRLARKNFPAENSSWNPEDSRDQSPGNFETKFLGANGCGVYARLRRKALFQIFKMGTLYYTKGAALGDDAARQFMLYMGAGRGYKNTFKGVKVLDIKFYIH